MTDHPITPPPELTDKWKSLPLSEEEIFVIAARWGGDQELEACCADIYEVFGKRRADWLRSARRPKPPSLKEQALHILDTHGNLTRAEADTIRRALETIPDDQTQRDVSFGQSLSK